VTVFGGKEPVSAADAIPAKTTPTWEMEMLLSGATVFGLLQLPAALRDVTEPLLARLGGGTAMVASILAMYVGAAVYVLLATFIVHLTIRGFWIALLGLRSIYPDGPDFERLRGGPIARDVARRHLPRMDDMVERLDNLATICFVFGAITVVGILMPGVFLLPTLVAVWAWPEAPVVRLLVGSMAVLLGPMVLATLIDALFGRHLNPEGRIARFVAAVLRVYQRSTQPAFLNIMTTTLMTRLGFGRFMTLYVGALFAVLLAYAGHAVMRREGSALGNFMAVPAQSGSGWAVLPQHYRDQRRDAEKLRRVPFIDAAVLSGDWLRVIIPADPSRHEPAIAAQCPQVWVELPKLDQSAPDDAASDAVIRALMVCYRDAMALRIDGQPVNSLPDIVVLPESRLRGLQFMIDARGLASGRHVLQAAKLADPDKDDADTKPTSWRIPFWK